MNRGALFCKLYSSFVWEYEDAINTIASLRASKPAFAQFLELSEKCEGVTIQELMSLPMRRIPQYLALLQRMIETKSPDDIELPDLKKIVDDITAVNDLISRRFHEREARLKVFSIQQSLDLPSSPQSSSSASSPPSATKRGKQQLLQLVTPTRLFLKEGVLKKRYNKTTMRFSHYKCYCFFLFNDALLYTTKPNANGLMSHKYLLPLEGMTVTDVADGSLKGVDEDNVFEISQHRVKTFLVSADSAEHKREWIQAIKAAIAKLHV